MKKYLFVGLILLLILISACHTKTPETGTTNTQTTGEAGINDDSQTAEGQTNEEAFAIVQEAYSKTDNTLCDQIEISDMRSLCLQKVLKKSAIISGSEELCQKIINENDRTECLDNIYLQKANAETDSTYCDKIINVNIKTICEQHTR